MKVKKYVCNLFNRGTVLQIYDTIMDQSSDEVHVDLHMFGSLLLYWIFAKLQCTLIITPENSWLIKLYSKLYEEVWHPISLICSIYYTPL